MRGNTYYKFLRNCYKNSDLNFHQYITTVYRPFYVPLREIMGHIKKDSHILDIGTGSGLLLFLSQEFIGIKESFGFDLNSNSIQLAKSVNKYKHLKFYNSEIKDEVFSLIDTVTMIDVIHHIPQEEKKEFIENIFRKIKRNTLIIIKDLNPKPMWMANANKITDYISTGSYVSYMDIDEMEQIFLKYKIITIKKELLFKHLWSHYLIVGQK